MVSAHGERSDDDLVLAIATLKRITGRYWSFLSLEFLAKYLENSTCEGEYKLQQFRQGEVVPCQW